VNEDKAILEKLENVEATLEKHDRALFGEDGRGGVVSVVQNISTKMSMIVWIAGTVGAVAIAKIIGLFGDPVVRAVVDAAVQQSPR